VFLLDDEPPARRLPPLAEGVELIGRYDGSGFEDAPYIAKRRDGQVVQLTHLLFLVAANLRADGDADAVARAVSRAFGRDVSADNVDYLVQQKLRLTGLVATPESESVPLEKPNPLLALKLRLPLVPERVHRHVTNLVQHLFWPPLIVAAVIGLIALDVWLITDLGGSLILAAQLVIYQPQLLLPITALTLLMVLFHEFGHAGAARYGGATPGAMGAGIYLVWPVFYTDVTDAYRLDRRGRLRVDLGGVYFNTLFTLGVAGLYLMTDHVVFVVFLVIAQLETLRQLLPFVRLDGYYIVCDLAGVPNLFEYIKPAMARLVRRDRSVAPTGHRFDALTKRSRVVLTIWACITAPVFAVNIFVLLFTGPRLAGAAFGSASRQIAVLSDAVHRAAFPDVLAGVIGLVFLVLPTAGMLYILVRMSGRARSWIARSWGERPFVTAAVVGVLGGAAIFQMGFVWPETFASAARPPRQEQLTTETRRIPRETARATISVADLPPLSPPAPPTTVAPPPPPVPAPGTETGAEAGTGTATDGDTDAEGSDAMPSAPSSTAPPTTLPAEAPAPPAAAPPAPAATPAPTGPREAVPTAPGGPLTPAPVTATTVPPTDGTDVDESTGEEPAPTTSTTLWSPLHDLLSFLPQ
jgi:putative peptide zinc metalloprotease protein